MPFFYDFICRKMQKTVIRKLLKNVENTWLQEKYVLIYKYTKEKNGKGGGMDCWKIMEIKQCTRKAQEECPIEQKISSLHILHIWGFKSRTAKNNRYSALLKSIPSWNGDVCCG